jgi:hypothetical protein
MVVRDLLDPGPPSAVSVSDQVAGAARLMVRHGATR